jgi:hypothetical protein
LAFKVLHVWQDGWMEDLLLTLVNHWIFPENNKAYFQEKLALLLA